eukprot:Nk52_evm115s224 gene=Nk52_evmTU115s224
MNHERRADPEETLRKLQLEAFCTVVGAFRGEVPPGNLRGSDDGVGEWKNQQKGISEERLEILKRLANELNLSDNVCFAEMTRANKDPHLIKLAVSIQKLRAEDLDNAERASKGTANKRKGGRCSRSPSTDGFGKGSQNNKHDTTQLSASKRARTRSVSDSSLGNKAEALSSNGCRPTPSKSKSLSRDNHTLINCPIPEIIIQPPSPLPTLHHTSEIPTTAKSQKPRRNTSPES